MSSIGRLRILRRGVAAQMSSMNENGVKWRRTDAIPAAGAPSMSTSGAGGAAAAVAFSTAASASSSDAGEVVEEAFSARENSVWRVIKAALYVGTTAAATGAAYVSYAYKTDDVEKYLSSLKSSANVQSSAESSILEKIRGGMFSAGLTATSKVADYYLDVRKSIEDQVQGFSAPSSSKLLPDLQPQEQHVFTLVLDLNETLVFSDWKRDRGWRTFKRPGVEAFLEQLGQYYELVVYSDQLSFYVDPILDRLDQKGYIRYRLSRDATQYIDGKHMRDLSKLNRDPAHVIYLSGHAAESTLNPENALPIRAWKLEADDTSLLDLLPFLEYVARNRPGDIRAVLSSYQGLDVASEFRVRHQEYQRRMQERKQQNRFWRGSGISR